MASVSTVLIVDDNPLGREALEDLLYGQGYKLGFAADGFEALRQAAELMPDVILLDVMMPGMDGFEVCRRLRADEKLAEVPVVLVTALDDRDSRLQGIEAGADDFISKPYDRIELRARVRTITRLNRYGKLRDEHERLIASYNATIEGLVGALDLRDKETENHTVRVTQLTVKLARAFGLDEAEVARASRGATLHDIGKLGVSDQILHKPGPLTPEEWVIMRKHPQFAHDLLMPIEHLRPAVDIPYCHHEKWDGSGYPRGLKGDEIPLTAQLFAVIDVWDALTSTRPYKQAWLREKALEQIRSQAGTHFNPRVVELFLSVVGAAPE